MDKDWKDIKEGDKVWLSAVFVDMVGSTKIERLDKDKGARYKELFRITAERTFERFGAERIEWHGEGTAFFFTDATEAIKASIEFIAEVRVRGIRDIEAEIGARVSISSGLAKLKEEMGTMDEPFISTGGHLNSDCPENSILITEDTYDSLSDERREKFAIFGTTKRDKVIAFIWPKERAEENKQDPAFAYLRYIDSVKSFYQRLPSLVEGIPKLELTRLFYPLKVKKREKRLAMERWGEKRWGERRWGESTTPVEIEERTELYSESPSSPFDEVFKEERHIIILGDPGSGKTTLLKWLFLIYSQGLRSIVDNGLGDNRLLPILLPISALYIQREKKGHISPLNAICGYIEEFGVKLSPSFLKEKMEKGDCLVLLDGLDELPEKADRFEMADYIARFISAFGKNRFVVTSRPIGFIEITSMDKVYTLAELDDEDIKGFIKKWSIEIKDLIEADSLIDSLDESPAKPLARNPLLLTLICSISATGRRLPKSKAKLYRQCCEILFERWPYIRPLSGGKRTKPIMEYEEAEKILAQLALEMHKETAGLIERDELRNKIIKIMGDDSKGRELFSYLTETTQLLIEKGSNRWGFIHLSFQEFLAAVALYWKSIYLDYLMERSDNPNWREVFLLLCGYIEQNGKEGEIPSVIEGLLSRSNELEEILHKNLLLAGEIIAELRLKGELAEKIIRRVIDLALRSEYDTLRNEATKVLKKGKELSVGRLLEILGNKDKVESKLRRRAVETLGEIGAKESIPIFTSILKDRKYWKGVRTLAASALGKIDGKASIPILTSILKDKGEDRGVRSRAASALGNIGEKESIPILTSILKDKGENGWVRNGAVFALSEIGGKASIPILTSILKDKGEDREVRVEAASALGRIGEKASIPILTSILKDKGEDREVRAWAASALGKIGGKASIPILTSILKDKGENGWVRNGAAFALGKIGEKESIPILTAILTDKGEDGGVRGEAAIALSNIGEADEEIIHILIEIISKREKDLWILTISSATKLGLRINDMQKTIIEGLNNPSLNSTDKNRLFSVLWRLYS
ncbi:HEAT repeat domain-containing protein [bacterium]|nr:HEAT repeat domain-containing protein [bacterium]